MISWYVQKTCLCLQDRVYMQSQRSARSRLKNSYGKATCAHLQLQNTFHEIAPQIRIRYPLMVSIKLIIIIVFKRTTILYNNYDDSTFDRQSGTKILIPTSGLLCLGLVPPPPPDKMSPSPLAFRLHKCCCVGSNKTSRANTLAYSVDSQISCAQNKAILYKV